MTDTATVAVTAAEEAAVTREYVIRVRVVVPADTNMAALDKAMAEILDIEDSAAHVEDALYYDYEDVIGEAFERDSQTYGVMSFEMDTPDGAVR